MAEDPNDHRFWFPAHEAGHAVDLIDAGIIPTFIRLDHSASGPRGQTAIEDQKILASVVRRIASAGIAAEFMVWRTEQASIAEDLMTKASLKRATEDRNVYDRTMSIIPLIPYYPQNTSPTKIIAMEILKTAQTEARPIIEKNLELFVAIRETLENSDFVGRASIVKLIKRKKPSAFDRRLDRKQQTRFQIDHDDPTYPLTWREYIQALVGW